MTFAHFNKGGFVYENVSGFMLCSGIVSFSSILNCYDLGLQYGYYGKWIVELYMVDILITDN